MPIVPIRLSDPSVDPEGLGVDEAGTAGGVKGVCGGMGAGPASAIENCIGGRVGECGGFVLEIVGDDDDDGTI